MTLILACLLAAFRPSASVMLGQGRLDSALERSRVNPFQMPERLITKPSKEMVYAAIKKMRDAPLDRFSQLSGCGMIGWRGGQDTRKDWMLEAGAVDVVVAALRAFPQDKQLQIQCGGSVSGACLFNRPLSLRAGELGAVELLIDIMRRWPEDPKCQIGGMSGGFMDFSGENRARWAAYGGVEVNLDSIRRFYNNSEVVLQAMYGFSSGTEDNDLLVAMGGGLELFMQILRDHVHGYRVPEETFQAIKFVKHPKLQSRLMELGFPTRAVEVMRELSTDRFMQDPACVCLNAFAPNATQRSIMVKSGVVEVAFDAAFGYDQHQGEAKDTEHAVYDGYRPDTSCMQVVASLGREPEGRARLLKLGAREKLSAFLQKHPFQKIASYVLSGLK